MGKSGEVEMEKGASCGCSVGDACGLLGQGMTQLWLPAVDHAAFAGPLALGGLLLCAEWFNRDRPHTLSIENWPVGARWFTYLTLGLALVIFGSVESRAFVYFQF